MNSRLAHSATAMAHEGTVASRGAGLDRVNGVRRDRRRPDGGSSRYARQPCYV
jgi:hypothetical protein